MNVALFTVLFVAALFHAFRGLSQMGKTTGQYHYVFGPNGGVGTRYCPTTPAERKRRYRSAWTQEAIALGLATAAFLSLFLPPAGALAGLLNF